MQGFEDPAHEFVGPETRSILLDYSSNAAAVESEIFEVIPSLGVFWTDYFDHLGQLRFESSIGGCIQDGNIKYRLAVEAVYALCILPVARDFMLLDEAAQVSEVC